MTDGKVVIIGAGLAGLCAARLLHRSRVAVEVIEARDRLGGRILTVEAPGSPGEDGFDLGPSWFWPRMQPSLGALVDELGLPSFEQFNTGDIVVERFSREGPMRARGFAQEPQSMRLAGGTAALVRALVAELPDGCLQVGRQVTALDLTDGGVRLTVAADDGASHQVRADRVIAAMPPRVLEATVAFSPALDAGTARRLRATPTWMAPHAKVFVIYDRPFWREAGLCGTAQSRVGPLAEIHDATTASGQAALFGFVGIGHDHRAALGEPALMRACIEQLGRIFGPQSLSPRATLVKDWAADPLTATPSDRAAAGHPEPVSGAWVTGPWATRLFLAGSETSSTEPGYLAGAVQAAGRAVAEVQSSLSA